MFESPRRAGASPRKPTRSPSKLAAQSTWEDDAEEERLHGLEAMLADYRIEGTSLPSSLLSPSLLAHVSLASPASSRMRAVAASAADRYNTFSQRVAELQNELDPQLHSLILREFIDVYGSDGNAALEGVGKSLKPKPDNETVKSRSAPSPVLHSLHSQRSYSPSSPTLCRKRAAPTSPNRPHSSTAAQGGTGKKPRPFPALSTSATASSSKPRVPSSAARRRAPAASRSNNNTAAAAVLSPTRTDDGDDWDLMDRNEASRVEDVGGKGKGRARKVVPAFAPVDAPRRSSRARSSSVDNNPGPRTARKQQHQPPTGEFTYEPPGELNDEYFMRLQADLVRRMRETLEKNRGEMSEVERQKMEKRLEGLSRNM